MPENPNCAERAFSKYDTMDDEALRDFLRSDASKTEAGAADIEELLYVMGVLEKRRKERGEARDPEKAFEEFKKYYDPRSEAAQEPEVPAKVLELPLKKKTAPRWKRRLAIAAAVIALLVGCTLSVGAAKFDLWELFVKFTRETFYIEDEGDNSQAWKVESADQYSYSDFAEMLRQHDVSGAFIPTWIPEGFTFTDRYMSETPLIRVFRECYVNGNKMLTIEIVENHEDSPIQFEQFGSEVEIYQQNNDAFYLFRNETQYQATCVNGAIQCTFSGNLTHEEMIQMLDSIKKV